MAPADAAIRFGPSRATGVAGVEVGPVWYRGRRLRGEFLPQAVRSDTGQLLVLSQFQPLRLRRNALLLVPLLALVVVIVSGDPWHWLDTVLGGLLVGLTMALTLAFGVIVLQRLWQRLRGRVLTGRPAFRLLLIDEHTGQVYRQRGGDALMQPLRIKQEHIYFQPAPGSLAWQRIHIGPESFRKLQPRQAFQGAEQAAS